MKALNNHKFRVLSLEFNVGLVGLLICCAFSLSSCDNKRVVEENKELKDSNWYIDSVQTFPLKVEDASKPYNLLINVRNSESYPYYNLFLRYYLLDSTKKEVKSQQLELILMDPVTGKPTGNGLGDIYAHQYPLLKQFTFPKAGLYYVKLKQYMRQDPLPEINSIGIRLENYSAPEKK